MREAALVWQSQVTTGYSRTLLLFMAGSFLEGLRLLSVFCTELCLKAESRINLTVLSVSNSHIFIILQIGGLKIERIVRSDFPKFKEINYI